MESIEEIILQNNRLLKKNNEMLQYIIKYLKHKHNDYEDFMINVAANVVGNQFI